MKTAVVLFNLGGPDELDSVKPFLFNLFSDPAIMTGPKVFRWLMAKFLAHRRAAKASAIYQQMGGKSPLLESTQEQASALESELKKKGEYKVFVSMRYWHPLSEAVAKNVKQYTPDHILLLPLYPQFSVASTGSSYTDWQQSAQKAGLTAPTTLLCCYPAERNFIAAHVKLIREAYWKASEYGKPRVLFSAHGLPEKFIHEGDPYQWQVEKTAAAIVQVLAIEKLDYAVCYQSKVGPLKWLSPSTDDMIVDAGRERLPLVVVPVSFVSEHAETLVELDIDYRKLAEKNGVRNYQRVPSLSLEPLFIEALASLCLGADREEKTCSFTKVRYCSRNFAKCPCGQSDVDSDLDVE